MALSLEELWNAAADQEIVAAIGKWTTINEKTQRVLAAEVKRRGLDLVVPEMAAGPTGASSEEANPFPAKILVLMAAVIVAIVAYRALVP